MEATAALVPAVTAMARAKAPRLLHLRPASPLEGLVFDALVALPNPPTVGQIAHWTDLPLAQAKKALDRMRARGEVATAGTIPRRPSGYWQTYRFVGHPA